MPRPIPVHGLPVNRHSVALRSLVVLVLASSATSAQVLGKVEISDLDGGFGGVLADEDRFGSAVANLGDLDGDSVTDVAVGAGWADADSVLRGKLWVLLLNADGTVKSEVEIGDGLNGFVGPIGIGSMFGSAIARLAPGGGTTEVAKLAVGCYFDNDGIGNKGSVWILRLDSAGQVIGEQKVSATQGGFAGPLDAGDWFGYATANLGDFDGDGVDDIAVGALQDDDGGPDRGAVWLLFLNADGTVKSQVKLSDLPGTPAIGLDDGDQFGCAIANLGDLNGDLVTDLAVGSYWDDDGGVGRGAVRILFLGPGGAVVGQQKISSTSGKFAGTLEDHDHFGSALASMGDLDGDGVQDLAVGVWQDNDGSGSNTGAVYLLFLNTDGTVKDHRKISETSGGWYDFMGDNAWFGSSVASLGDFDGSGRSDMIVGQWGSDDGGPNRGAVWVVTLGCLDASSSAFRNAGTNPASLSAPPPILGGSLGASVDLTTTGHTNALVFGFVTPLTLTLGSGQTVLVNVADPNGELLALPFQPGPLATFTAPIPPQLLFCSFPLSIQAIHFGGVAPYALSNAQDLHVGY